MKPRGVLSEILCEIRIAARDAPLIFFAPLIGALRGVRAEYARLERQRTGRRPAP